MINVTDLRNGVTFGLDGQPYQVESYAHIKMGRGGATIKIKARNLLTGSITDKSFNSGARVDSVDMQKKQMQYLYLSGDSAVFMDPTTFDQVEIVKEVLGPTLNFLKEGELANVHLWEGKPLWVEIAPKVTLTVKSAAPGVKGNSASNIYKPAILENDLEVKVPLFIKPGDKVRVDTRTGEYVERVNS